MGASNAQDIFQAKMGPLFKNLEFIRAYLDDLLIILCNTHEDHLDKLGTILNRLQKRACVSTRQDQLSLLAKLITWDKL